MLGVTLEQVLSGEPPRECVLDRVGLERVDGSVAVMTLSRVGRVETPCPLPLGCGWLPCSGR